METDKEIEIELPEIFKNMTPTKIFVLVLILAVILLATFYLLSSRAQREAMAEQEAPEYPGLQVPGADQEVTLYILNDGTCISCTTGEMMLTLRQLFTNLNEIEVDYNMPEGKVLAEKSKTISVPAYILERSVENSSSFQQIRPYLFDMGDYYVIRVLGRKLITNEEIPNKLDLFVMPTEANAIAFEFTVKEFIDTYKPEFAFYIVAHEEDGEIVSVVGEEDVAEGIRQVCAMKYEPDLFNYILCRNVDINASWAECAENLEEMRECSEGVEGLELMRKNLADSKDLGVGASPTLIINNQLILLGNQPYEMIEAIYCNVNPDSCTKEG